MCSTTQPQGRREASSRSLHGGHALWFCFSVWMLTARQPWLHLCAVYLLRHLGSATAPTAHFCSNAHQISLPPPPPGWKECQPQPDFSPFWAEPQCELPSYKAVSVARLSIFSSLVCSHLPTFKCFNTWPLRCICALNRESLVKYSCSNSLNFKGSSLMLPFFWCHSTFSFL